MKPWQRRTIGILSLGGGAIGTATATMLLVSRTNPLEWLFLAAFAGLYAWGIWCGVRLLERQPGSERPAFWYWLIQVPVFGSPLLGYFLASGFHLTAAFQFAPFKLNFNFMLGSQFNYSLMQPGKPWLIGVNLFAGFIAWWLARSSRRHSSAQAHRDNVPVDAADSPPTVIE